MSQQEDDLRSLAKIMDMLRGVAMILVVANIYWFCRELVSGWRFHPETMKVLSNLNDAGSLFSNPWNANGGHCYFLPFRASARKVSRMRKSNGGKSGLSCQSGRLCSFSTGGCFISLGRFSISSQLWQVSYACC